MTIVQYVLGKICMYVLLMYTTCSDYRVLINNALLMDSVFKICKTREDFVNYQRTHRLHAFKGHNKDYIGSGEIQQDTSM